MADDRPSPCTFLDAAAENGLRVLLVYEDDHVRPASGPEEAMYRLLERIRGWDVLNPSDGIALRER